MEGAKEQRGLTADLKPMQIEPGKIQKVSDLFHAKKISEAEGDTTARNRVPIHFTGN